MNVSKILDFLADLWSKHAPTVFMHVILFLLIRAWVLDPGYVIDSEPLWVEVKSLVQNVLKELGFQKIEIGYVLAVLILIYLTVIQWLAYLVSSLRSLAIIYRDGINPDLLVHAGTLLRTEPQVYRVLDETNKITETYLRQIRDQEKPEPFDWTYKQVQTWARYYGLALIAFFAAFLWYWNDSEGAKSSGSVLQLLIVILIFAAAARYKAQRHWRNYRDNLHYAALHEHYRHQEISPEPFELRYLREDILRTDAKFYEWYEQNPSQILRRWLARLPKRIRKPLEKYLTPPRYNEHFDWDLLRSQKLKQEAEEQQTPQALDVEQYRNRFSALLECEGSGLCLLVDPMSGLAPSVPGGGSSYSFATRSYKGQDPAIRYFVYEDGGETVHNLRVQNFDDTWGFLVDAGDHPIELIAQEIFPNEPTEADWWQIAGRRRDKKPWNGDMFIASGSTIHGVLAKDTQTIIPGHSYLYRCKTFSRVEAIIAFQCFFIEGRNQLLIPWKILDVIYDKPSPTVILPWWNPRAWRHVFQWPDRTDKVGADV